MIIIYIRMYNRATSVLIHTPSAQKQLLVIWFLNACYETAVSEERESEEAMCCTS